MGLFDFLLGKPPTQNIETQDPLRGPGYDWAQNFFNQYLPQFMDQSLPTYPGQLDPGLSPTMQALMRQAQNYSMSPFPDIMGQSSSVLGRYMNQPYDPYQYQSGPEQQSLQGFMNPNLISPQSLMSGSSAPNFGFGQGIDVSQGQGLLPPGSPQASNRMGLRSMSGAGSFYPIQTPYVPSNEMPIIGGGGGTSGEYPRPTDPPPEGGGGSIPPGWNLPPLPGGRGGPPGGGAPNLSGIRMPSYSPIQTKPSFVNWDPFNPYPSMGPGGAAAVGPPRQPGAPGPPARDPNAVVPQGQLEWFGRWRGPNAGKTREEAVADMWRRGWDMGGEYAPSQSIIDQWTGAGEPTGFGSKPTYGREINQRLGLGTNSPQPVLPPGSGLRVGGAGVTGPGSQQRGGVGDYMARSEAPKGGFDLSSLFGSKMGDSRTLGSAAAGSTFTPRSPGSQIPSGAPGQPGSLSTSVASYLQNRGQASPPMAPRRLPGGPVPQSPPQGPPQPQPGASQGTSYLDAWRSGIPVIQEQLRQNVADAMASSGITGNRFSSSAQREAGRAGAAAGQQIGSNLINALYQQTEADKNRALQATGMGLQDRQFQNQLGFTGRENYFDRILRGSQVGSQLGLAEDQMAQNRLQLPFELGRYEQDRQDRYPLLSLQDFQNSRLGYFPYLAQLAGAQGAGSYVPPITTQGTAQPGLADLGQAALPWWMMFSDRDLKRDIEPIPVKKAYDILEIPGRMFRWKHSGKVDAGVIAQEVEDVAPELVTKDKTTKQKMVSYNGLVGHLMTVVKDLSGRIARLEAQIEPI